MPEKEIILTSVSDPSQIEAIRSELGKHGYEVITASSVPELVKAIEKTGKISLAVVDVAAYDDETWKQLQELQKSGIPFFVISPDSGPSTTSEVLKHGASGLFSKGLRIKDLLEYIRTLLNK